jgi:rubrerythrin
MSHQSSQIPPDPDVDEAVTMIVECSYCAHEIEDHENTWPCPHCNEFAFPLQKSKNTP